MQFPRLIPWVEGALWAAITGICTAAVLILLRDLRFPHDPDVWYPYMLICGVFAARRKLSIWHRVSAPIVMYVAYGYAGFATSALFSAQGHHVAYLFALLLAYAVVVLPMGIFASGFSAFVSDLWRTRSRVQRLGCGKSHS
jgi:hypothetical protein